jgi:CRISPR-associated protein (TIGR03984 family)
MKREIKATRRRVDLWQPTLPTTADLRSWLLANAPAGSRWLLAHQEDGVIWGKISDGDGGDSRTLTTADQAADRATAEGAITIPAFRLERLLECRVFGGNGELMVWRTADGWRARRYQEADDDSELPGAASVEYIDEAQILWGTQQEQAAATPPLPAGFTLVADGAEGLRHAVPLTNLPFAHGQPNRMYRPLRLQIRHYLAQDGNGMIYIYGSRLVKLEALKGA